MTAVEVLEAPVAISRSALTDEQAIDLLEGIVRIRSLSGEERGVADFLIDAFTRHGIEAHRDEVGNAIATVVVGRSARAATEEPVHVVLLGHMDTVPGDIPVRRENGRLHGRGTVDAKGPLTAFAAAMIRAAPSEDESGAAGTEVNFRPVRITFVGCVEEEAPSSRGARHVIPRLAPDFCIVGEPSGWDRITLGYKGYLRGRVTLTQPCTHSAHGDETVAERACRIWSDLKLAADGYGWALHGGPKRVFDRLLVALLNLRTDSDGCTAQATLDFAFRLPPDLSPHAAEAWVKAHIREGNLTTEPAIPAFEGDRNTDLHRAFTRAIRAQGASPRFVVKTGTADLNLVAPAWQCPALAYGPGDAALDHTPEEHIVLEEYLSGIRVLEAVLSKLRTREAWVSPKPPLL